MDIHVVKSFSDSCQKDVREFKNLTTICSRWSNHRYEVHPIGGEIEETHHGYTCSHCTQRFNINIFIIAVLNKSETVLGCKSK